MKLIGVSYIIVDIIRLKFTQFWSKSVPLITNAKAIEIKLKPK